MSNTKLKRRPVALIILSGFGWSPLVDGNAVAQAYTPFLDKYLSAYKHTLLEASGERVGLPFGQAGNSEINHTIIGTGQVAPMTITRVDEAIATGRFFENPTLISAIDAARDSTLHLMGLLSDGGVHSRSAHLYALLKMAADRGVRRVFVHAFTDGRDTPPKSGQQYVEELMAKMREIGVGRIATITGRYYAMDRDDRWDRVKRAYDAIARGEGRKFAYPGAAIEASYDGGLTDEFIEPAVITEKSGAPLAVTQSGDSVIFFNLRADRARQLTRAFTGLNFDSFERERIQNLHFATFTQYDRSINTSIIFPPGPPGRPLAALFAEYGVANLRVAETERYAHVTYFFNGGVEMEFPYESRILMSSQQGQQGQQGPQATAYDSKPEMSAFKITDKVLRAIDDGETGVYVVNFANADMVGHTGNLKAAIEAVESLDICLGWLVGTIERVRGAAIITSDNGNCEQMIDPATGGPHTAHTTNPVPFILCDPELKENLREGGSLED
ncbi:MAG: 2,3-bisphosphoglycerate-independent phosphoglycerate mutase, partial [Blastocatellia bacterium]|nr:2,3-bisphosphoglycerate-independent phosphoglycerate mutase [Blastocatellia bacterium]